MNKTGTAILQVEQHDGLLQLTLNRPHKANALDPNLTEALLESISAATDVRLCVLRGAGRHFCTGFDLTDLEELSDGDLLWRFLRIEKLLQLVHLSPFPVAAFAQGQVVGAGADLFAACWRRVAAPDTRFRMPGWNFELALGTRRLKNLIGTDAARDLLIDTRSVNVDEGQICGLVTDKVAADQWTDLSRRLLQRASQLTPRAMQQLLGLTSRDSREADIAAIVESACQPGLRDRIIGYRDRANAG